MQLEQTLEMYQSPSMQRLQERQRVYTAFDLESLSATALYASDYIRDDGTFDASGNAGSGGSRAGFSTNFTWLTSPQPVLDSRDLCLGIPSSVNSINYFDASGKPLGGLSELSMEEMMVLLEKYTKKYPKK